MRICLISRFSGNLPAFEAVFDDMPPVEKAVCVGDVVGYNPPSPATFCGVILLLLFPYRGDTCGTFRRYRANAN